MVAVVAMLAVLTLAVVLGLQAGHENARTRRLRGHGVSVSATITHCLGLASGTGITETGYQCHAAFDLDGRSYTALLRGTTALYPAGETVAAVVDPRRPQDLIAEQAIATSSPYWKAYLPCAVTVLALVMLIVIRIFRRRRSRTPVTSR